MAEVFMSYSHEDSQVADELGALLEELGIDYFRDVKDIKLGEPLTSKVRSEIDACVAVLVIVSPASLKSHWVPYEIGRGGGREKTILPYLTHPSLDVPDYIRELKYATSVDQLRRYFADDFAEERASISESAGQESDPRPKRTLNDFQVTYLLDTSRPRNEGLIFGSIDSETGRDVARYQEALKLFINHGLMEYRSGNYHLTQTGWVLADELWALKILDALDPQEFTKESVLAKTVGLTDGEQELQELKRHSKATAQKGWIIAEDGDSGWQARLSEEGLRQRERRTIQL